MIDELRVIEYQVHAMSAHLIQTPEEADRIRLVTERVIRQLSTPRVAGVAAKREAKLEEQIEASRAANEQAGATESQPAA